MIQVLMTLQAPDHKLFKLVLVDNEAQIIEYTAGGEVYSAMAGDSLEALTDTFLTMADDVYKHHMAVAVAGSVALFEKGIIDYLNL